MKEQYIAAKERWALKMAGKAGRSARSSNRLPPGQRQVHNWPVLDLGLQPEIPLDKWELKIHGKVENPVSLAWDQFRALPQFKDVSDFHCVTTWSQFDMEFSGVAFFTLADLVKPKPEGDARFLQELRRLFHQQPAFHLHGRRRHGGTFVERQADQQGTRWSGTGYYS